MRGFVYEALYLLDDTVPSPNFLTDTDCTLGHGICLDDGSALSSCAHNQFISGDDCINCHPSCYQGCSEAGTDKCFNDYYCHPSCRTCEGPGEDDCLDCFCGSHRSNAEADTSSCECNAGTVGAGCEQVCVEGCDICEGGDENECLYCAEGYLLDDYTFGRCILCETERSFNPTATCENQGPKNITGSCTC